MIIHASKDLILWSWFSCTSSNCSISGEHSDQNQLHFWLLTLHTQLCLVGACICQSVLARVKFSHCSSNSSHPESLVLTSFQTGERRETQIQKKMLCRSINGVTNSCSNGIIIRTQWNATWKQWELARNYLLPMVPSTCLLWQAG